MPAAEAVSTSEVKVLINFQSPKLVTGVPPPRTGLVDSVIRIIGCFLMDVLVAAVCRTAFARKIEV